MPSSAESRSQPTPAAAPLAWVGVAAALLLGSVALSGVGPLRLDWQPGLAWQEPWRAWTAAWVHYSALHLLANLFGGILVAAFGVVARLPRRAALAWLAAWPLTQIGLALRPDLSHYGGLSGVLHAGVGIVAIHLLIDGRGARRWLGGAVLLVVAIKIGLESPLGPAFRESAGWDIAVAPFAHLSGLAAGVVTGVGARLLSVATSPRRPRSIGSDG